jgi:hypothetical protein
MTPFLDLILITTHLTYASDNDILYDSTKATEATVPFDRTETVQILHGKGMKILPNVNDGLFWQRAAFSDKISR